MMPNYMDIILYVANTAIFIGCVVGAFLFYLFILPLLVSVGLLNIFYAGILSLTNFVAILLSWIYFRRTHCIDAEANPIAAVKYRWFGVDLTHFLFFCVRAILVIYLLVMLLTMGLPDTIPIFGVDVLLIHISVTVGMAFFTVEMFFNIYALIRSKPNECNEERPKICSVISIPGICHP